MKIRRKLFLAFSIYMVLALIPSLFAYREMDTIRNRLEPVEIAGDITNAVLDVRRQEKNFLLLKDQDSLQLLRKHISMLKGTINVIEPDIIKELGRQNYLALQNALRDYEGIVQRLSDNFSLQNAAVTELTRLGREIEKQLPENALQARHAAMPGRKAMSGAAKGRREAGDPRRRAAKRAPTGVRSDRTPKPARAQ